MSDMSPGQPTWGPKDRPRLEAFRRYFFWADTMRKHLEAQTPNYHDEPKAHSDPYMAYWYGGLCAVIDGWRALRLRDETITRLLRDQKKMEALREYRHAAFHFSENYFDARFVALWEQDDVVDWVRAVHLAFAAWMERGFPEILLSTFARGGWAKVERPEREA